MLPFKILTGQIHKNSVSIAYPLNLGENKKVSNSPYIRRLFFHLISSKYNKVLDITEL